MAERRHYEVMVIVDPRLDDAKVQETLDKVVSVVTDRGGEATKVDNWGRRKLAYEMDHLNEGYYAVIDFEAEPAAMDELDRVARLSDELMRHKIVRPGRR